VCVLYVTSRKLILGSVQNCPTASLDTTCEKDPSSLTVHSRDSRPGVRFSGFEKERGGEKRHKKKWIRKDKKRYAEDLKFLFTLAAVFYSAYVEFYYYMEQR